LPVPSALASSTSGPSLPQWHSFPYCTEANEEEQKRRSQKNTSARRILWANGLAPSAPTPLLRTGKKCALVRP
jgi:hypothetical protein